MRKPLLCLAAVGALVVAGGVASAGGHGGHGGGGHGGSYGHASHGSYGGHTGRWYGGHTYGGHRYGRDDGRWNRGWSAGAYVGPTYVDLGDAEPTYFDPGYGDPDEVDPGYVMPAYVDSGYPGAYVAPGYFREQRFAHGHMVVRGTWRGGHVGHRWHR